MRSPSWRKDNLPMRSGEDKAEAPESSAMLFQLGPDIQPATALVQASPASLPLGLEPASTYSWKIPQQLNRMLFKKLLPLFLNNVSNDSAPPFFYLSFF